MAWRRYSDTRARRLSAVEDLSERFAMSPVGYAYLLKIAPPVDRVLIPRTRGRWSSVGRDLVGMVSTTGATSGRERSQPLVCIPDGDGLLLVGSNYGRPRHPGWVHNLRANPQCTVTFRGSTRAYEATRLEGEPRAVAWAKAIDWIGGYERYEAKARPRLIDIFRLVPSEPNP